MHSNMRYSLVNLSRSLRLMVICAHAATAGEPYQGPNFGFMLIAGRRKQIGGQRNFAASLRRLVRDHAWRFNLTEALIARPHTVKMRRANLDPSCVCDSTPTIK